jgi:hypothetical protein
MSDEYDCPYCSASHAERRPHAAHVHIYHSAQLLKESIEWRTYA